MQSMSALKLVNTLKVLSYAFIFTFCFSLHGQTLIHSLNYDEPSGLYDQDSLRSLFIDFYDDNYHAILEESWEKNDGTRLPAEMRTSDGLAFDSVGIRYRGNSTFGIANDNGLKKLPLNIDTNVTGIYTKLLSRITFKKCIIIKSIMLFHK